jgi:DNA-binding protein YbaB
VSNDAIRHDFEDLLAQARQQMSSLARMQAAAAALTATATAAEGTVEVTVDAGGVVTRTSIDESYCRDFLFADLGAYVTEAARRAAGDVTGRAARLRGSMAEQRRQLPALSDVVDGAPDLRALIDGARGFASGDGAYPKATG